MPIARRLAGPQRISLLLPTAAALGIGLEGLLVLGLGLCGWIGFGTCLAAFIGPASIGAIDLILARRRRTTLTESAPAAPGVRGRGSGWRPLRFWRYRSAGRRSCRASFGFPASTPVRRAHVPPADSATMVRRRTNPTAKRKRLFVFSGPGGGIGSGGDGTDARAVQRDVRDAVPFTSGSGADGLDGLWRSGNAGASTGRRRRIEPPRLPRLPPSPPPPSRGWPCWPASRTSRA